jgi:lipopolysaccharide biosynthesis protein
MTVRSIAFYLPQFHPIPENDAWWGTGFTEWRSVAAAKPKFVGHYQPRIPADLGFYDLRVPETRAAQAKLARDHGIHGFCYYHYWFDGKRLLERPLDEVIASGQPDFPFCVCWANENWTRRWDGRDQDVLIEQHYGDGWEGRFIRDLLPVLCDPRYIRIDGRPLLVVYRPGSLPDAASSARRWRDICRHEGVGEIYLAHVHAFELGDPRTIGFDAAIEFPPLGFRLWTFNNSQLQLLDPDFRGQIHHYPALVDWALQKPDMPYTWFRGIFPGWDNSPRVGNRGRIFAGNQSIEYRRWLEGLAQWTRTHHVGDEQLVFINAWNEWGEGAYLEPDLANGHAFLEATRAALMQRGSLSS